MANMAAADLPDIAANPLPLLAKRGGVRGGERKSRKSAQNPSPHLPHFSHIINGYVSPKTHPDNDDISPRRLSFSRHLRHKRDAIASVWPKR